jgi:hypothetical protein
MDHGHEMSKQCNAVPLEIEDAGAKGEAIRANIGRAAYNVNVQQYCCAGLNFGADHRVRRGGSAALHHGELHALNSAGMPYADSLAARRTVALRFDGPDLALLGFDRGADVSALASAAKSRRVPLTVIDVDRSGRTGPYQHKLVLSRPDQHVAWQGDSIPAGQLSLIDQLRGAGAT